MGRKSQITIAAILSLAIASCASEGTPEATNPTPPAPPAASPAKPVAQSQPQSQSFEHPLVSGKNTSQARTTPSLIQSTNGQERVVMVSKGRTDPFAQIVGAPISEISRTETVKPVPILPPLRNRTVAIKPKPKPVMVTKNTAVARLPMVPRRPLAIVPPKDIKPVVPSPKLAAVLPPPVQPEIARAVIVSGVILIGQEPQAIIKMPNEATSRYVQAGQRLSDGVLIKRIDMNNGDKPVVILEQYGIEVARMVGEAPVGSTPSATSTENPVSATTAIPKSS